MSSSIVYALDFDGVICDSCGESSTSAFLAAKKKWPDIFSDSKYESFPEWMKTAMRKVRPVVETGYENVLLIRLLHEEKRASDRNADFGSRPLTVGEIMANWKEILPTVMEKWGVEKEELVELFGSTRDEWIKNDFEGWIRANTMYPGVIEALNRAESPVYIITTKQTRFVEALFRGFGLREGAVEAIFGLGSGSKISVLKKIFAMERHRGAKVVFVEDRWETLEAATISLLGANIAYYLAEWGYNTEAARRKAEAHPFTEPISLVDFTGKMV